MNALKCGPSSFIGLHCNCYFTAIWESFILPPWALFLPYRMRIEMGFHLPQKVI